MSRVERKKFCFFSFFECIFSPSRGANLVRVLAMYSQGITYAPWNATVNVGAFADLHAKSLSAFVRGEMDAGKYGTLVADVEGVELQKDWTLGGADENDACLLYTSPSPRDGLLSRMPSSA